MRISIQIRTFVANRANYQCEYCRIKEDDMFLAFEVDHIISLKHGGDNNPENLAYACPHCNQHKGTDIAIFVNEYRHIVPLFNPRIHQWDEHFLEENGEIIPKTDIGQAATKILQFNDPDLIIIRRILKEAERWP